MYLKFRTKYEVKNRPPKERPVRRECRMYPRCIGCPYCASGFICWHENGTCMATDVQNICAVRRRTMR